MRKRQLIKAAICTAAVSPLLFMACVDNDYDLSQDIDMTVTVGGDLAIPGSSTEEITLADILELEEGSIVEADENGDYTLIKGSGTTTEVTIDPVVIEPDHVSPSTTNIVFDNPLPILPGMEPELGGNVDNVEMDFEIKKDDVTQDVTWLTSAKVDFNVKLKMSFTPANNSVLEQITLREGFELTINFSNELSHHEGILLFTVNDPRFTLDEDAHTITFNQDIVVDKEHGLEIPLAFSEIKAAPGESLVDREGHFDIKATLTAHGEATIPLAKGHSEATLTTSAEVGQATLLEVTGMVDPEIEVNIDPVDITGVPDLLNDKDTKLDLKNPFIKLVVNNPTPASVNMQADIISMLEGNVKYTLHIGTNRDDADNGQKIVLEGDKENIFYLSRENMTSLPAGAKNIVLGDGLNNLIKQIPDQLCFENVDAKAIQEEITVQPGETFTINTDYEMNAKLAFGSDLNIVYKDTINDLSGDLEDIMIHEALVELTAENGIPMNFDLTGKAIDVNGNSIENVSINVENGFIKAGDKKAGEQGGTLTESKIALRLLSTDGHIDNLDGLIFTLEANSKDTEGVALNKNMIIRLKDIRIRIVDGVTVDLN